jgi:hypothetical protein
MHTTPYLYGEIFNDSDIHSHGSAKTAMVLSEVTVLLRT